MPLYQWSTTPNNNANASTGVNWAEGQLPSTVNNSARQMMADVAQWYVAPEWLNYGLTPTYVNATQFTVTGNQTATYQINRRVRALVTAGTIYGTITASVYTTLTTVTVTWDSGALDSGVSEVDVHIVDGNFLIPASNTTFDGSTLPAFFLSKSNRVVDSIAVLRALSHLTYTRAFGTGYYVAGDGGGGSYYYDSTDTTSGAFFTGSIAPITSPSAPALGSSAGGSLGATTYYTKITYVTAAGETLASAESSLAVAANNVLTVTSPAAQAGATGYNVYVSTSTGTETKQNSTPISIGTNWTEPTSGLIAGAALPSSGTAGSLLTVSAVTNGTLAVGQQVNGAGSVALCYIAGQVSGTGGTGTYTLTGSQTVASQTLTGDNGVTVFVAFDGARWKLAQSFPVSVKQAGAKGDGANDDTYPIQATINATYLVYLPSGTYKTTSTITLRIGTQITGAGMLESSIAPTTAVTGAALSLLPGTFQTGGVRLAEFGITGNAVTTNAISMSNMTGVKLDRLYVYGFTSASSVMTTWSNVESSMITGCYFLQVGGYAIRFFSASNANLIQGCAFNPGVSGANFIAMDTSTVGCNIISNNFEGSNIANVGISCSGTDSVNIEGNFFELFTGTCILANSGSAINLRIANNQLNALSAASGMCVLNSSGGNDRVTLENNTLMLLGNTTYTTLGFILGNTTNIWARGNKSTGSGTGILNIQGSTLAVADYCEQAGPQIVHAGRLFQAPAFSSTLTINPSLGEHIFPGPLTANITIGAPSASSIGQELNFNFIQDGTGGRTVTWNSAFIRVAWSDAGNAANARSSIKFVCLDGTNWLQVGAQKTWS